MRVPQRFFEWEFLFWQVLLEVAIGVDGVGGKFPLLSLPIRLLFLPSFPPCFLGPRQTTAIYRRCSFTPSPLGTSQHEQIEVTSLQSKARVRSSMIQAPLCSSLRQNLPLKLRPHQPQSCKKRKGKSTSEVTRNSNHMLRQWPHLVLLRVWVGRVI